MITPEQIKNLKPGDPIVINTTFHHVDDDGDIWFDAPVRIGDGRLDYIYPELVSLPSEHGTSVPTPKHDPTRLFKKGDKVRLTKWNGRICENFFREGISCGENLTVVRDEDCFLNVTVRISQGIEKAILSPFLELVTPVEELEPFSVEDCSGGGLHCYAVKHGVKHVSYHLYQGGTANHFYTREQAKAAAEAECDRLNAEYRKEQK